ncbi:TRAP transporter small permease [Azospirillum sp. ST 5-10]|uniref:TRAP transporter small permease n=1 Tax=unclassified Azospirillum TaxID=2630922 RepID=UPI003F4A70E1
MPDLLSRFERNGERWLLLGFYSFIVLVIFVEVVRRFVLSYSSVWGEETARFAFIYLVWIGAASAVRERAHIRIDVLTDHLPERAAAALYMLGDLLTLALAVTALYWSLDPVVTSLTFGSVTDGLRIGRAWFLVAVPFGFLLIVLRVVQSMARDVADLRAGRPPYRGARLFD